MTDDAARRGRARAWPVLQWAPGYQRSWLRFDLIAGLTVCAILVPEGMAYAELAGVPPEYAFYAAPIGLLAYAVLGSSRQLVVAVSSAVAIMSAATISEIAAAGSAEYIALTAALALLAGLASIVAGVLKLGRVAQFFSESVLLGFVFGLALLITVKQLPKILGVEAHGDTALAVVRDLLPHLRETDLLTLAVGACGIAVMIVLERLLPRLPAALVVLIGSILVSAVFGLEARGVVVVGELPAGLKGPSLPGVGLEALPELLAGALAIALVAFAEAIGPAQEFAREHGGKVDPDRELIALGAANAGAGLFSGFPIGSSLSKSAANDRAGARTPASLITAAAATALVALFLTPLFEPLPEATLGAIVVVAVAGMMKVGKMRRLWRLRRLDFWLAMIALAGVLVMPTLPALGGAVVISLGMLVWRASQARLTFLGRARGGLEEVDLRSVPDAAIPGLLIVRPDEMLFFANAASVRDDILGAVAEADPRPSVVLLDLGLTPEVDVPVVEALEHLHERLAGDGVELWLSDLRPAARDLLDRAGALDAIGPERIHAGVIDGILAFALHAPGAAERVAALSELLAFLRERAARPDVGAEGAELLAALEERLARELAAAGGGDTRATSGEPRGADP
ncbi:MAG: SulP family inorganic anion transporter [Gammaproteobacteria bacterium]|jgi:high affinity sulfate transporter 1|nr:SulP family inorganic anion transporter [Gammaproteobacteria bacterium]